MEGFNFETKVENIYNYQYFVNLYVGTHFQEMSFIIDTGSSWTWLPNSDCPYNECVKNHYNYGQSGHYTNTGKKENVKYSSGQVEGYVVTDDMSIFPNSQY